MIHLKHLTNSCQFPAMAYVTIYVPAGYAINLCKMQVPSNKIQYKTIPKTESKKKGFSPYMAKDFLQTTGLDCPKSTSRSRRRRHRSKKKKVWVRKSLGTPEGDENGAINAPAEAAASKSAIRAKKSEAFVSKNAKADKEKIPKAVSVSTQTDEIEESHPILTRGKEVDLVKKRPASLFVKRTVKKIICRDEAYLARPAVIAGFGANHEEIRDSLIQSGLSDPLNYKWIDYVCRGFKLTSEVLSDKDFAKGEVSGQPAELVSRCIKSIPKGLT